MMPRFPCDTGAHEAPEEEHSVKFYNVKTRQAVEVPDSQVTVVTMKNGRVAAQATVGGVKLFKILGKEEAARLQKQ